MWAHTVFVFLSYPKPFTFQGFILPNGKNEPCPADLPPRSSAFYQICLLISPVELHVKKRFSVVDGDRRLVKGIQ